jgi:hypothetical protein
MIILYFFIFWLPFLLLSFVIVGIVALAQKHFRVKPQTGIPIASCIIALAFAFVGYLSAQLVLDAFYSWATKSELVYVYKTAIFGSIYGVLMGIPLYKVANDFGSRTSEITKSELAAKLIGVSILISIGLFCVSLYYVLWQNG